MQRPAGGYSVLNALATEGSGMSESSGGVEFEVMGWPPKKNEAKSLFAAGHKHADKVRALLEAAQDTIQRDGWTAATGEVLLELSIRGPGRPDGDATNFLGGVADVLQTKAPPNLDVTHLGDLASVGLYLDDKQISRISYREVTAAEVSYRVRVATISQRDVPK
jgi:hypothetical protein